MFKITITVHKLFLLLLVSTAVFFSFGCEEETQFEKDREAIRDHLEAINLEATATASGLYYNIIEPGGEVMPSINDIVEVRYRGELLDGTVFDETEGSQILRSPLGGLIRGWQLGLPLIGRGGRIELFIPSSLGYGNQQVGDIPANSVLYFNISLLDFE
ncbi:peptidylprolyl isomerase [Lewinellaceae bacterium SD302]|nr:peptidylprolyl isomerase [Lewinellaceae bacterium SD302]